jgi:hypothetical protein
MSATTTVDRPIDIAAFEAGSFDPSAFDHPAHVRVAWSYLQQCELGEAIRRFTRALHALTVRLDITGKYHETITWFFIIAIAERIARDPDADWESFRRRNPDLFRGGNLLRRHYSAERLRSPLARRQFLLPDLPSPGQG